MLLGATPARSSPMLPPVFRLLMSSTLVKSVRTIIAQNNELNATWIAVKNMGDLVGDIYKKGNYKVLLKSYSDISLLILAPPPPWTTHMTTKWMQRLTTWQCVTSDDVTSDKNVTVYW